MYLSPANIRNSDAARLGFKYGKPEADIPTISKRGVSADLHATRRLTRCRPQAYPKKGRNWIWMRNAGNFAHVRSLEKIPLRGDIAGKRSRFDLLGIRATSKEVYPDLSLGSLKALSRTNDEMPITSIRNPGPQKRGITFTGKWGSTFAITRQGAAVDRDELGIHGSENCAQCIFTTGGKQFSEPDDNYISSI
ncbi:hypothetical protein K443DRAFT_123990 [Laccaria amethystina LaAM-08-1]|uniref:Uncharacterized protein n=1 Tax=Laccaria amethystina LaAM-08-1 TaxID=1095629 RepID=A0A0C9XNS7_9AGAR|nr:hypothetical protein K443DRAFT_123990 [Laccaria amethystina LaAM-08-1]